MGTEYLICCLPGFLSRSVIAHDCCMEENTIRKCTLLPLLRSLFLCPLPRLSFSFVTIHVLPTDIIYSSLQICTTPFHGSSTCHSDRALWLKPELAVVEG